MVGSSLSTGPRGGAHVDKVQKQRKVIMDLMGRSSKSSWLFVIGYPWVSIPEPFGIYRLRFWLAWVGCPGIGATGSWAQGPPGLTSLARAGLKLMLMLLGNTF